MCSGTRLALCEFPRGEILEMGRLCETWPSRYLFLSSSEEIGVGELV